MSYQIAISNSIHEQLLKLKGTKSYSEVIDTLLQKNSNVSIPNTSITNISIPDKSKEPEQPEKVADTKNKSQK